MTQREFISNSTTPRDCLRLMREGTEKALHDRDVWVIAITYDGEFDWGGRWDEDGLPLNLLRLRQSIEQDISEKYGRFQGRAAFEVKRRVNQLFQVDIAVRDLATTVDDLEDVDITMAPQHLKENYDKLCSLLDANPSSHLTSAIRGAKNAVLNAIKRKQHRPAKIWINDPELNVESLLSLGIPNFGEKKANAILEYRSQLKDTKFKSLAELKNAPLVGPKLFEALEPNVCLGKSSASAGRGKLTTTKPRALIKLAADFAYAAAVQENLDKAASGDDQDPMNAEDLKFFIGSNSYFSRPERSKITGKLIWKSPCATHLLKNCRNQICSGRFDDACPERARYYTAFKRLLDEWDSLPTWEGKSQLPPFTAAELDGSDIQKVDTARRMFHINCVKGLRALEETAVARFVEMVHYYSQAFDTRGIPMATRSTYLVAFKQWLMEGVDICSIDLSPGSTIKGISIRTWEQLLISIDSYLQMGIYLQKEWGGNIYEEWFNSRCLCTDPIEEFFSGCFGKKQSGLQTKTAFVNNWCKNCEEMRKRLSPNLGYHLDAGRNKTRNTRAVELELFNDPLAVNKSAKGRRERKPIVKTDEPDRGRTINIGVRTHHGSRSNKMGAWLGRPKTGTVASLLLTNRNNKPYFVQQKPVTTRSPALTSGSARATWERGLIQRQPDWHQARRELIGKLRQQYPKRHPMSASSLVTIFGHKFTSERAANKEMRQMWEWLRGDADSPPGLGEKALEACAHGTINEINAVATFLKEVVHAEMLKGDLPSEEDIEFHETGLWRLSDKKVSMVAVSPDGILMQNGRPVAVVEIKCPYRGGCPKADPKFKAYHLLQVHAQMKAVGVDKAYLISWGPDTSKVFPIKFNEELWGKMTEWIELFWESMRGDQAPEVCDKTKEVEDLLNRVAVDVDSVAFCVPSWKNVSPDV